MKLERCIQFAFSVCNVIFSTFGPEVKPEVELFSVTRKSKIWILKFEVLSIHNIFDFRFWISNFRFTKIALLPVWLPVRKLKIWHYKSWGWTVHPPSFILIGLLISEKKVPHTWMSTDLSSASRWLNTSN